MACAVDNNSKCAVSKTQKDDYCGRLVLDAGIEFLARPATPPQPPKHNTLTRFFQRIFGKDCPNVKKKNKEACKKLKKRHNCKYKCEDKTDFHMDNSSTVSTTCDSTNKWYTKGHKSQKKHLKPTCQKLSFYGDVEDITEQFNMTEVTHDLQMQHDLCSSSSVNNETCEFSCRKIPLIKNYDYYLNTRDQDFETSCDDSNITKRVLPIINESETSDVSIEISTAMNDLSLKK